MNVKELRIHQSITGLIAKTNGTFTYSCIPFCCSGFTDIYIQYNVVLQDIYFFTGLGLGLALALATWSWF